jgi:hypothetical protein
MIDGVKVRSTLFAHVIPKDDRRYWICYGQALNRASHAETPNSKLKKKYSEEQKQRHLQTTRNWKKKHSLYLQLYNYLYQPRHNQLHLISRTIKRGYGWTS